MCTTRPAYLYTNTLPTAYDNYDDDDDDNDIVVDTTTSILFAPYESRTTDKPIEQFIRKIHQQQQQQQPKTRAIPKKWRIKTFSFYLVFNVISRRNFVHNNFFFFFPHLYESIGQEKRNINKKFSL